MFERAEFNKRSQLPNDETVNDFVPDLHKLSEFCDYGKMKDNLIRDRIVVGITDDDLSEKLQCMKYLTQCVQKVRQKETVQQQQVIRDQDNVNAISARGGKSKKISEKLEIQS